MTSCARQLDDYIQHYGVKNYYDVVTSLMDQLRDEPLNVAVLGRRRHDKQLFLQAMCKNLAFNRAGLGASNQKRGSLQIPSFGSRTPSANNSLSDVHAFFQNGINNSSSSSGAIAEEGSEATTLMPSPVSGYDSTGAHTPPWKTIPSLEVTEQDEGVFVNEDAEGCDAEVAQLMALQASEVYTEKNISDILTYRYPEYPEIRFWDIPDFDAEGYTRQTFEDDVKHGLDFDAFLVTSGNRFLHPDDLWWAELLQREKSAVFICTHMDREISRMKQSESSSAVAEHATFRRVHSYYRKKFFKHSLFGLPLFIVSPTDGMKFDFPDLTRILLKWKDRKQRARKNKLLAAALSSIEKKHTGLQLTYSLASTVCGILAGLPSNPIPAALADCLLYFARYSSRQDFGLNSIDLEDCQVKEEETEKDSIKLTPRTLLEMAPCSTTWLLQTTIGKSIMWATPDIAPEVVQTSLSLVAVGGACIWSQVIIANQLAEHKAKSKMVVEHITNRKLVTYLKQIGDIGSTTAAGTRSSSPVSFSV